MAALWILFFSGFLFVAIGLWVTVTPMDVLWERHKRCYASQGLAPERTEVWERMTRRGGYGFLICGVSLILGTLAIAASVPTPASGIITVNKR